MPSGTRENSLLIVLSGPSGAGKDAVIEKMKTMEYSFYHIVTATTRPQRAGEKEGMPYHFLSREQFQGMVERGEFLEWATVYGNYYGVPREEIMRALSLGKDVILKTDIQGATTLKRIIPQAVFIFLMPPSLEALEQRLKQRSSEPEADLALRLKKAREEIEKLPLFDYVITNREDRLQDVASRIQSIVVAEKCRVSPRKITVETALNRGGT